MSHDAPVGKDGFFYADDSLYVEVRGNNRHPRATLPELRTLFHPASAADAPKEPVGHWYEAQLLHYGLPPSKNKAVAKSRLLDAVNKGNIVVPADIQKVEAELRKKWTKMRGARAELKNEKGSTAAAKTSKRKAAADRGEGEGNINIGGKAAPGTRRATATTKGAPQTVSDLAVDASDTDTPKSKRPRQTAKRGNSVVGPKTATTTPTTFRSKQTAKRGSSFSRALPRASSGRGGAKALTPSSLERPKPMARRGGGIFRSRRMSSVPPEEEPDAGMKLKGSPSDPEYSSDSYVSRSPRSDAEHYSSGPEDDGSSPRSYGQLGLLSGCYEIDCPDLEQWELFDGHQFTLTLILQSSTIWGAYDFGMFSGILFLPQRPREASGARLEFRWRGQENGEGEISFADHQMGWIKFLGNGEIEGMISVYGEAHFTGIRVSGSGRNAASMRREWEGYNQEEYDRQNRARWGGSGW